MTIQDAIKKINKILGFQKFNSFKLKDSDNELILEKDLAVDEPVFIITDNGQLPAKDGEYILEDTTKIKIEDGKIREIKYDMEKKNESFVEAALADGTIVKSPTFDVGEDVFVVSPDGKESPAPDGEHELFLKDSEGKEVKLRIIAKDGKIVERMNVENESEEMGMTPDLSDANGMLEDEFKKKVMEKLESLVDRIDQIKTDYEDMKAKVSKFSKEPAGEPVKQAKNVVSEMQFSNGSHLEQLIAIRANAQKKQINNK